MTIIIAAAVILATFIVFGPKVSPAWFVISLAACGLVFVMFWRFGYLGELQY